MSWRFRKRIRLAKGLWINLSKKGGSLSVGGRGATMNISKKGLRSMSKELAHAALDHFYD
jgi:ribosomal protein L28